LRHARDFARYWTENVRWAAPPLLLDTVEDLDRRFVCDFPMGSLEAGRLTLETGNATTLRILDGQHRVFGWFDVRRSLNERAAELQERLARGRRLGNRSVVESALAEVDRVVATSERLMADHVTVEVLDRIDLNAHKQSFFDIAANAKGITKSLTTAFDQRDSIKRATVELIDEYEGLAALVEREADRVGRDAAALFSASQLLALVEVAVLGPDGWVRRAHSEARTVQTVKDVASAVLDALFNGFDDLQGVLEGGTTGSELRERSLLGSVTFLRALAGVFHKAAISVEAGAFRIDEDSLDSIVDFFQQVADDM